MSDCISYEKTNRFKPLFIDYINNKKQTFQFYNRFPTKENFEAQIIEKSQNYASSHRNILVKYLNYQYSNFNTSEQTKKHIQLLGQQNTFCITTGHQLNLFTGPLYTFYKIISVINTCKTLKEIYPKYNFVPIFWLASEDHDFEEINHFHLHSKTLTWQKQASGAIGELSTSGLDVVLSDFKKQLPKAKASQYLETLFKAAYLDNENLSKSSIYLYNELFGKQGLIVLEPNHRDLKSVLKPCIKQEILNQTTYKKVSQSSDALLKLGYHEQVSPREINFFYKQKNLRERLILKNDKYFVNHTNISFSKNEMLSEIEEHPERFSPNALLRPLYQEVLLPNLSYIGGAGELAYWLQLKATFQTFDVTFPMLQMRNSVMLYSEKTQNKLKKLNVNSQDLFKSQIDLKNQHVKFISKIPIDFTPQKNLLSKQFEDLYKLADKTDKTFLNAVAAQEKKQKNGLDKLEKRLLKAQRRRLDDELKRLVDLQDKLFPKSNLQERIVNFSDIYLTYGDTFIDLLQEKLDPFDYNFLLLMLPTSPKSIPEKFTTDCI